jgi:hypothetical protein
MIKRLAQIMAGCLFHFPRPKAGKQHIASMRLSTVQDIIGTFAEIDRSVIMSGGLSLLSVEKQNNQKIEDRFLGFYRLKSPESPCICGRSVELKYHAFSAGRDYEARFHRSYLLIKQLVQSVITVRRIVMKGNQVSCLG